MEKRKGRNPFTWQTGARREQEVGRVLDGLRNEGFRALHDLDIGRGNVDHVVVGPTGVFTIETKNTKANLYPKAGLLMQGRFDRTTWVKQASRGAVEIKRRLALAGIDRFVPAIIVSVSGEVLGKPLTFGNVDVIELANLADHLRWPRSRPLDLTSIERAVAIVLRGELPVTVRSLDMT